MKLIKWISLLAVLLITLIPNLSSADLVSTLEVTSPINKNYVFDIDQTTFTFSVPGDVTANIQFAGDGADDSDFSGFIPGNIALIERGLIVFSMKVQNAWSKGAIGAIIFDNVVEPVFHGSYGGGIVVIPSVFVTYGVGTELLNQMNGTAPVTVHLSVASVPEPTTMLLLGLGLIGVARFKRRIGM